MRSEKLLREMALNIAQFLPDSDNDDDEKVCQLAVRLRRWRDRGEPLEEAAPSLGIVD